MRRIGLESPAASMGQATSGVRPPTPRRIHAQLIGSGNPVRTQNSGAASTAAADPGEAVSSAAVATSATQKPSVDGTGQQMTMGGQIGMGAKGGLQQKEGNGAEWCHLEDSMDSHDVAPVVKAGPRRVQAQRVLSDDD